MTTNNVFCIAMTYFQRFVSCAILCSLTLAVAQDPQRFEEEVQDLNAKYDTVWNSEIPTLLFTGSSSIRLWDGLEQTFPKHQVVNTGFGGSQASDLLAFIDDLILRYHPAQVFIYEGDNDIEARKKPKEIISVTQELVMKIKDAGMTSSIVLISAKPSIDRWQLRRKYKRFNKKLKKLCEEDPVLQFANVWDPMLNGRRLKSELFIEDGLHMNAAGYEIWYRVLKDFVK